jgi:membrane fusion protein, multidrug efflux system
MIAGLKRIAVAVSLIVVGTVIIYFGHRWYERSLTVQTTDDAYVRGEITAISSRVSGYAVEVPAKIIWSRPPRCSCASIRATSA